MPLASFSASTEIPFAFAIEYKVSPAFTLWYTAVCFLLSDLFFSVFSSEENPKKFVINF